jgi:hypothetical protein
MNRAFYVAIIVVFTIWISVANVSASGLRVNETSISVNKTYGNDAPFSFTLYNDENFSFYNITFDTNSVTFPVIAEIPSKNGIKVNAVLKSDVSTLSDIPIRGLYYNNLGQQFKTYYINVTSVAPYVSTCDISLVVGDSVVWNNKVLDPITMENTAGVPIEGGIIQPGASLQNNFNVAGALNYRFKRSGFVFTPNCLITAVNSSGLVNNQLFDGKLKLNINLKYEDTIVTTYALTTNYTMDFNAEQQGIMSITNTGTKPAYNVKLNAEWFSFSESDFTLNPGQTKGIVYTITPVIVNSNQTGQTYVKQILTSGNFQTMSNSISIKINSANIGSGNNTDADYLIKVFCPRYPNSTLCNPAPRVEYRYITNNTASVNFTLTQQQYEDIWAYLFSITDEQRVNDATLKEMVYQITSNQNLSTADIAILRATLEEDKKARDESTTNVLLFVGIAFTLLVMVVGGALIYLNKKKKMIDSQRMF